MTKWCFNYESGEYEYIGKDGYSIDRGEYVYNWDDSEYRREEKEEEERRLAQERKENSPLNKGLKWFKRMTQKLTEEE